MDVIVDVITKVGFPIAMCLLLWWQNTKESERHREETKEFTDALNKNSTAFEKLHNKIEELIK